MADVTPNLNLPFIIAAQAQKHVTHNEAIRALDAIVQLSVLDRDLTVPPSSPADGDRFIVGASATGAWAGKDEQISAWQDNAWIFHVPVEGWICWVADEDKLLAWDGAGWVDVSGGSGSVNPVALVGVNATADINNRLSISSPSSLFNHEGNGHQQKINKASATDTASQLYQTAFSGRAEVGLTGDDDFHFKVSPDGTSWFEGIVINKDSGRASFPNTATREVLTIDRTYYVRTDGNDVNDGLINSAGGAFVSLQAAVDAVMQIDANGFAVTIQVADGTYAGQITILQSALGASSFTILGNEAVPGNCVINHTGNHAIRIVNAHGLHIKGLHISVGGGYGSCIYTEDSAFSLYNMSYGACPTEHLTILGGSKVASDTNYKISGGAIRHIFQGFNSSFASSNVVVTIANTPNFSQFVYVDNCAVMSLWNHTINGNTTGQEYVVANNAIANTFGNTGVFPGDVAGAVTNGGRLL